MLSLSNYYKAKTFLVYSIKATWVLWRVSALPSVTSSFHNLKTNWSLIYYVTQCNLWAQNWKSCLFVFSMKTWQVSGCGSGKSLKCCCLWYCKCWREASIVQRVHGDRWINGKGATQLVQGRKMACKNKTL